MIIPSQGNVNKFENPELLPRLAPGEKATFKLLNIKKDPDHPDQLQIPYILFVKPKQRVVDVTSKDKNRKWVVMANVTEERLDGNIEIGHPRFTLKEGGYKILDGNNPKDADEYTFLMLCNENGSNENRDTNVNAVFEEVVIEKIAKEGRRERQKRYDALDYCRKMKDQEVKDFAAAMNWNQLQDMNILRNQVEDMAEATPEEFMNRVSDGSKERKTWIKNALDQDIIYFDIAKKRYAFRADNSTIFSCTALVEPKEYVNTLSDFFVSNAKSGAVYDLMISRVKGKLALEEKP